MVNLKYISTGMYTKKISRGEGSLLNLKTINVTYIFLFSEGIEPLNHPFCI